MKIVKHLLRLVRDDRGATAIEYGLIMAMVFLAMVGAVVALGDEDSGLWNDFSGEAVTAMSGAV